MLGKKQNINNDEWLRAVTYIEKTVSRDEINNLMVSTINDIKNHIKEINSAYAWSGGKDSIVLGDICQKAGVNNCMIGICNLEYPKFLNWIKDNKPKNCKVINTGQDIIWLSKNQNMLFPKKSDTASKWFSIVQHRAQRKYVEENNIKILILGRRKADGNFVGRKENIYTDSKGITKYSPLSDWRHEDILSYIYYNKLKLPPIYNWYNGYKCGTHPWPARQWTNGNGWSEIYNIDKSIVVSAAKYISSASEFLKNVEV